ncbi:MAG: cytochrome c3 family protein [Alphaproteobacteria bacterium]
MFEKLHSRVLKTCLASVWIVLLSAGPLFAEDYPTAFTNRGGILNTRHNMTQSTIPAKNAMITVRNDYGEVCVYCHTPHGSNTTIQAPLWNRTIKPTTYSTYDQAGSAYLRGAVSAPGPNSLTCLSCHDGQSSIDSIINMPGSGGYNAAQMTSSNNTWLTNQWVAQGGRKSPKHFSLSDGGSMTSCLVCHNTDGLATDFTVFAIGTNLTNDHPIGVSFGAAEGMIAPNMTRGNIKFWDLNGDGIPERNEVRLYDSGNGFKVECASCHDPHGVPSAGNDSENFKSFLRMDNSGSALCQSCHAK